jgi:hypothetical protein
MAMSVKSYFYIGMHLQWHVTTAPTTQYTRFRKYITLYIEPRFRDCAAQGRKKEFSSWEHNLKTKISCRPTVNSRNNGCQPYVVAPIVGHGC